MGRSRARNQPLGSLADRLMSSTGGGETSFGELVNAAGRSAYGPLVLLMAVINVTPIGTIPGVAIGSGVVVVVLGIQMLLSKGCMWVPSWIERRSIEGSRVRNALCRSRPLLDRIDQIPRPRLQWLTEGAWSHAAAAGVVAMGILLFPMAFVPWGAVAPGIALLVVGLAFMAKDGLLMGLGMAAMAAAVGVSGYLAFSTFAA